MLPRPYLSLFIIFYLVTGCSGRQIEQKGTSSITQEKFTLLTWEQKIELFNSADKYNRNVPSVGIYQAAFSDPIPAVSIAALKNLPHAYTGELKPIFYEMLKARNPVVRWHVCEKISARPVPEDLPYFFVMFRDRDWMVRECAFKNFRSHSLEKVQKKYFFEVLAFLYEKNTQVLREIFKTVKWYNDPRAYPYMYKRSYVASNSQELVVVMQELSEINNEKVKQRIAYIKKNHPDFFVRKEAERILNLMN